MMPAHELPHNPGLYGWRGGRALSKVHIAANGRLKSLCGIRVPQRVMRPEEADLICRNCERVLREQGMLGGGG